MKYTLLVSAPALVLGALLSVPHSASASTILYDDSIFVQGQQSFIQSIVVPTAGTLTVTLSNIPLWDTISGLSLFTSTSSAVLGTPMTAGSETISVQPGTIYAHLFGNANGVYGVGLAGLTMQFQADVAAVPLPGTLVSLLSGLGLLFGWRRHQTLTI